MPSTGQSIKASSIVLTGVGVIAAGLVTYAFYFDYKRRHDVEFRKALRRDSKKQERAAQAEAEAGAARRKTLIREAVDRANQEDVPHSPEDVEAYFMQEVAHGEQMSQDSSADPVETALCFYKALKVYPQPKELINIYDKTVPKPILDILAEMIAHDKSIPLGKSANDNSTVDE